MRIGLVARMPNGPSPIEDDLIATIADSVPPPIATFLLTSEVDPGAVVDHARRPRMNTVQLVDDTTLERINIAQRSATIRSEVLHVARRDTRRV